MSKIFISYNRLSEAIVKNLADDIDALGHTVWLDQELSGGQSWWDQILSNIRQCDVFIFALSNDTLNSIACKREYIYGHELGKPILPVRVAEGVSTNLLPPALSKLQIVDYRQADRDAAIQLARALGNIPPPAPIPDPLPPPPEVPISYLGSLSEKVGTTSSLSYEEQSVLIVDLKRGLRDSETSDDAHTLLERLRKRRDLLANVADEIDDLLETRKASIIETTETPAREAPTGEGLTTASTRKANTRLKGTHLAAIWLVCATMFFVLSLELFRSNSLYFVLPLLIVSGFLLARKRWPVLEGTELAIYWLGCAVGFILLSLVFFELNNISGFGLSDSLLGLVVGFFLAVGSGKYLRRLWKARRPVSAREDVSI